MIKKQILLVLIVFLITGPSQAARNEESMAYKLATIYSQALDSDSLVLKKSKEPNASVVAEFDWLLQSLQTRCLNPEAAIADTMVETWQAANKNGLAMSLVEVARDLTSLARNTAIFGTQKINFRMTSKIWLTSKVTKKSIQEVMRQYKR